MLRPHLILTVFRKELREMLRDRRSLAVMFGVPLVLYPLLTIALATLGKSKVESLKSTVARVVLLNPEAAPELAHRLAEESSGIRIEPQISPAEAAQLLAEGKLEAVIDIPNGFEQELIRPERSRTTGPATAPAGVSAPAIPPAHPLIPSSPHLAAPATATSPTSAPATAPAPPTGPELIVRLDRSRTEAEFAQRKIDRVFDRYDEWVIAQRLRQYHAPADVTRSVPRQTVDVSTAAQRFGSRLSQLLPLLILVTGMLGALFPALAATTTERELGTLETLLVSPAGRTEILLAKGLLVLCCGLLTAALNVLSMSLVLWRTFSIIAPNEPMSVSSINPASLLLVFVAAVPALVFFTSLVLIIGLVARTFREANSYATPAMLLPLVSMALTIADVKSTPGLMITPIANTTLIMRDVLRDRAAPGDFLLALGSSLLYAGLLLSVAGRLFSNEQLVNPAWEPLSLKGLRGAAGAAGRRRRKPRLPAVDEAIALFAITLLLLFYVQPSLFSVFFDPVHPRRAATAAVAITLFTQLGLIFLPTALFAVLGKWDWRRTFKLVAAPRPALLGAVLLGIGLVPVVNFVSVIQEQFWPADPEAQRLQSQLFDPAVRAHPVLTALVIGACAGIFEELLFRGPIQTALLRRARPRVAITATAFLFAGAHLDLHGLPIRWALGGVLGYLVWRTGSLWVPIITHGLYDTASLALHAIALAHAPDAARNAAHATAAAAATTKAATTAPVAPLPPTLAPSAPEPSALADPMIWVLLAAGVLLILAAAWLIRRTPRATEQ